MHFKENMANTAY